MTSSSDCYEKSGDGRVPADFRCDEPVTSGSCYVYFLRLGGAFPTSSFRRKPESILLLALNPGAKIKIKMGPGFRRDDSV